MPTFNNPREQLGFWDEQADPSLYRVHEALNNKGQITGYISVNALKDPTTSKTTEDHRLVGACIELFQGVDIDIPPREALYQPLIDKHLLVELFGDNKREMWQHVKNVADLSAKALWLQHCNGG